jgi:hypothetical protein
MSYSLLHSSCDSSRTPKSMSLSIIFTAVINRYCRASSFLEQKWSWEDRLYLCPDVVITSLPTSCQVFWEEMDVSPRGCPLPAFGHPFPWMSLISFTSRYSNSWLPGFLTPSQFPYFFSTTPLNRGLNHLRCTGFLGIRGWLKSNCLKVVRVEIRTPSNRRPVPCTHKLSFCLFVFTRNIPNITSLCWTYSNVRKQISLTSNSMQRSLS